MRLRLHRIGYQSIEGWREKGYIRREEDASDGDPLAECYDLNIATEIVRRWNTLEDMFPGRGTVEVMHPRVDSKPSDAIITQL